MKILQRSRQTGRNVSGDDIMSELKDFNREGS